MHNIHTQFKKNQDLYHQVKSHILSYKKLLLAYSGGLDSTTLLDILTKLRDNHQLTLNSFILRAVHIHHGLSDHADMWSKHCEHQCKIRNIPFSVIHVDWKNNIKNKIHNVEAIARYLRYQELFHYLHSEEILLTAHHMNDQVETILLALKRGSGPTGLSGMTKNTTYNNQYQLLRPLLNCSRTQIEKYAHKNNLIWITDDNNENIKFDRNFLRIKILPLLYQRWPYFNKVIIRSARLCEDQENLLNELLHKDLIKLVDSDGFLFFQPLLQYSIPKRQALLRRWLINFTTNMPSYQLLNRIYQEIMSSRKDSQPILQLNKTIVCRRYGEKLYILPVNMARSLNNTQLIWKKSDNTIILPNNLGLLIYQPVNTDRCLSKNISILNTHLKNYLLSMFHKTMGNPGTILTHCLIRSPQPNELISIRFGKIDELTYILKNIHRTHLKKNWKEFRIPPWLRSRIPLLCYNNTLITAMGVFITQNGKATMNSNISWNLFWLQDIKYYCIFKNSIKIYLK